MTFYGYWFLPCMLSDGLMQLLCNCVTVKDVESIKPYSLILIFVCAISGAFQLVGRTKT